MTTTTRIRKKLDRQLSEKCPRGIYGKYVQVSHNRGIKVFIATYSTVTELFSYGVYQQAINEVQTLRRAKKRFAHIPCCYGLQIFKLKKGFAVGIVLQHLGTTRLSNIHLSCRKTNRIINQLENNLLDAGIRHLDVHADNVMFYRGKYWVIDFGIESVRFVK